MLHALRPVLRFGVDRWWDLHVHQRHLAPARGSVDFACSRIGVVIGEPWRTAQTPWPRTREHTLATSALLWQHLRDEPSRALSLTGRALPGPLPAGDIEDDPDTGFVEHHQGVS